jgi:hypothetical protein
MAILGLMSSEQLEATQSNNARRYVLYSHPTAAAPLTYLMSMLQNDEETDKPKFDWFEERIYAPRSTTVTNAAIGPFADVNNANLTEAGFSLTEGLIFKIKVADYSQFRQNDIIKLVNLVGTSSTVKQVYAQVITIETTGRLIVRCMEAVANVLNTTANNSKEVVVTGSAAAEGDRSKQGGTSLPIEPQNFTQIFRTVVGPFTRNALKMGQKFDKTGIYQSTSMKEAQRHMTLLEMALIMGRRSVRNVVNDEGQTVPLRTTGGILWFLEQWEKKNTVNGGAFDYKVGDSDISAADWRTTEDKRIIPASGTITEDELEELIRRSFNRTGDGSYEKLVVCDGKFLSAINKYVKRAGVKTTQLNSKEDSYGLNITTWESPHGIIHFKTHPLYNDHPSLTGCGTFFDFGNMRWRPFQDSDTELYKNRQNRDTDGRKDEWLTEGGYEINYPESFMHISGLTGITA